MARVDAPTQASRSIIDSGSTNDRYANHDELKAGLEAAGHDPTGISERQFDLLIAAYGGGDIGAIGESQLRDAVTDGALRFEGGQAIVDFASRRMSGALADAIISEGSSDDRWANRSELEDGLDALGFRTAGGREQLGILVQAYGTPDVGAVNREELAAAIHDHALRVGGETAALDFSSPAMAQALANHVVGEGSKDDALANADELEDGFRSLNFDDSDDRLEQLVAQRAPDVGAISAPQLRDALVAQDLPTTNAGIDASLGPARRLLPETPQSFSDELGGPAPRTEDRVLADIADAAYHPGRTSVGNGWNRVSDTQLEALGIAPQLLRDDSSGFKAGLYHDGQDYVMAYSGTDGVTSGGARDWIANIGQGLGFKTQQYSQAVELARVVDEKLPGRVIFTGHSLGGGLASAASAATGEQAVVFNPAGVHDATYRRLQQDPAAARASADAGQVRKYVVDGELLDYFSGNKHPFVNGLIAGVGGLAAGGLTRNAVAGLRTGETLYSLLSHIPKASGAEIELADPNPGLFHIRNLNPFHRIANHNLGALETSMDRDTRFAGTGDHLPSIAPTHTLPEPGQNAGFYGEVSDGIDLLMATSA